MVERTTNQQMDELISKMSTVRDTDDPLSDAATNQLGVFRGEPKEDLRKITKETDMLLDVAGKDDMIYEPDQKLDYKDTMGLLFPITPNDPIFEDIKTMFEKEKYGSGVLMATLTALAMIPGFGTLPKATAKKIARDTAESIKLSERKSPDTEQLIWEMYPDIADLELVSMRQDARRAAERRPISDRAGVTYQDTRDSDYGTATTTETGMEKIEPTFTRDGKVTKDLLTDTSFNAKQYLDELSTKFKVLTDADINEIDRANRNPKKEPYLGDRKPKPEDSELTTLDPKGRVQPTLDLGPQPTKITSLNTYDLKQLDTDSYGNLGQDNYVSRILTNILDLKKQQSKKGTISIGRFEKLIKEAPQDQVKYLGLQNLVDNAKKEGVKNLSLYGDNGIVQRYFNNKMILKEEYYKGHPEIPNSIDDATPVAQFLPYSSHFEGRSDIANTIADPKVGMFDMGFKNMFSESVKPKNYDEYVKQIVKATKPLVDVREYAELVVSLPNVRKVTNKKLDIAPTLRDTGAYRTRKGYLHKDHYDDETPLFHMRFTKNADIGDRKNTFIIDEIQSDIFQKQSGIDKVLVDTVDPETGLSKTLKDLYEQSEIQKNKKALKYADRKEREFLIEENKRRKLEGQPPIKVQPEFQEIGKDTGGVNYDRDTGYPVLTSLKLDTVTNKADNILAKEHTKRGLYGYISNTDPFKYKGSDKLKIIPEIPLTKQWVELSFKRALKEAIDSGADQIAWTTGSTQGKRYADIPKLMEFYDKDLHKIANKIHKKAGSGGNSNIKKADISFDGAFKIKDGEDFSKEMVSMFEGVRATYNRLQDYSKFLKGGGSESHVRLRIDAPPSTRDELLQYLKERGIKYEPTKLIQDIDADIEYIEKTLLNNKEAKLLSNDVYSPTENLYSPDYTQKLKDGLKDQLNTLYSDPDAFRFIGPVGGKSTPVEHYVMDITPEIKALYKEGGNKVAYHRGGIVQDKIDTQMNSLFGQEQIEQ